MNATAGEIIGCPDCGTFQVLPPPGHRDVLLCVTCDSELERRTGRRRDLALVSAASTLLFLIPANTLPFLSTSLLGATRQSHLVSSATAMWGLDYPALAIVIGLVLIVLPLVRFTLLTIVLLSLRLNYRPSWLGGMFRWSNELQIWAMTDVFLLALWVAYARMAATVTTHMDSGAYCFIAAGLCTLLTRATLDKTAVWRAIGHDGGPGDAEEARARVPLHGLACPSCDLTLESSFEDQHCPRCGGRVSRRLPGSLTLAVALTLAGVLLYIPANVYPIATIPIGLTPTAYNVLGGVVDLMEAHLLGLALLVFTASFAIPFIKLVGIGWCLSSILLRSRRALKTKTRTYRVIEEIGRWSMVDPLTIACFVPVTHFQAAISSSADIAAPFFTAVVLLTMAAARVFDPRLMWDAARTTP